MKKFLALITLIATALILMGCNDSKNTKVDIMASNFTAYDVTRAVVGENTGHAVGMAVKPGAAGHAKTEALTADALVNIKSAKLFVYMSQTMDGFIVDKKENLPEQTLSLFSVVFPGEEEPQHHDHDHEAEEPGHDHDHSHDHNHDHDAADPHAAEEQALHAKIHFWTSTANIIKAVKGVEEKLSKIDSKNAKNFKDNADDYIEKLTVAKNEFQTYVDGLKPEVRGKELFYLGHDALGAFALEYGIKIVPFDMTIQENNQIAPAQITTFANELVEQKTSVVFVPELNESEKVQRALSSDNRIKIEYKELSGYHNVSPEQFKNGLTYLELLKQNISNLKAELK